jgi:hypothetical protein
MHIIIKQINISGQSTRTSKQKHEKQEHHIPIDHSGTCNLNTNTR